MDILNPSLFTFKQTFVAGPGPGSGSTIIGANGNRRRLLITSQQSNVNQYSEIFLTDFGRPSTIGLVCGGSPNFLMTWELYGNLVCMAFSIYNNDSGVGNQRVSVTEIFANFQPVDSL